MARSAENLSMCLVPICGDSALKCLLVSLAHFVIGLFSVFGSRVLSPLQGPSACGFFPTWLFSFYTLNRVFGRAKGSGFEKVQLILFLFFKWAFSASLRALTQSQVQKVIFFFSPRDYIVLSLHLCPWVYCICTCTGGRISSLVCGCPITPAWHLGEATFYGVIFDFFFVKSLGHVCVGLSLCFPVCFVDFVVYSSTTHSLYYYTNIVRFVMPYSDLSGYIPLFLPV